MLPMKAILTSFGLLSLLGLVDATAQIKPKPATDITQARNAAMYSVLDFADRQDFQDATRGFIAGLQTPRIIYNDLPQMNALKLYAWNLEDYGFLSASNAPPSANPSLWRQEQLNNINGLFLVQTNTIYQIRSYDIATMSFIRSRTGWIVIDPLGARETARAGLALFRTNVSHDPVVAIICTHSHIDHYNGIPGILESEGKTIAPDTSSPASDGKILLYAPSGFYEESLSENLFLGNSMVRRADYMYGSYLPKGERGHIGSGLGKTTGFGTGALLVPTREIQVDGPVTIDGLEVRFQLAPGTEAPAEMHVFVPEYHALCLGENLNHTMHNLLTSRGAKVRDPKAWAFYLDNAIDLFGAETEVVIGTHHWPVWDNRRCLDLMEKQRDMYRFFNDQVIRMINNGMNMEEIAEEFELPRAIDREFYNRGYYGSKNHNVKAVFQRYVGWWDGNPANYFKYPDEVAARKYVAFMGGENAVIEKARQSYAEGDYRWVAEVMKHVVFANPSNQEAKNLQADAFEQLGYSFESGTWRNIFLSGAEELRNGTIGMQLGDSANILNNMLPTLIFDYYSTLVIGLQAESLELSMRFIFTDTDLPPSEKNLYVLLKNGVLHCKNNKPNEKTDVTYTLTKSAFLNLCKHPTDLSNVQVAGDGTLLGRLVATFDKHDRLWNIPLPLSYDNSRSNRVNAVSLSSPKVGKGAVVFSVTGIPDAEYQVGYTTNFNTWQVLVTNTSPFTVTNPMTPSAPYKFFRVTD
jgi:alkyl sulfatase BDS1-like metallo-beta-lactamase superfamily hydrolase